MTLERNPNFKTVKDAGADEVADANVDKITDHGEQEQQRPGDRHRAEQGRFHGRPAGVRPLQEVKTRYGNRSA
jgi:hypothetical protein